MDEQAQRDVQMMWTYLVVGAATALVVALAAVGFWWPLLKAVYK